MILPSPVINSIKYNLLLFLHGRRFSLEKRNSTSLKLKVKSWKNSGKNREVTSNTVSPLNWDLPERILEKYKKQKEKKKLRDKNNHSPLLMFITLILTKLNLNLEQFWTSKKTVKPWTHQTRTSWKKFLDFTIITMERWKISIILRLDAILNLLRPDVSLLYHKKVLSKTFLLVNASPT